MKTRITTIVLLLLVFLGNACKNDQTTIIESESTGLDLIKVRGQIQELDDQFSEDFRNADSVALAEHYSSDGTFGSIKGKDNLISAWGKAIRYANENGTPDVLFKINAVSSDGEFVVEMGSFEFADIDGNVKSSGKYLVVRKMEDGQWKMYRDIGL